MKIRKRKKKETLIIEPSDDPQELICKMRGQHVDRIKIPIEFLFNGKFEVIKGNVAADISFGNGTDPHLFWGDLIFYK